MHDLKYIRNITRKLIFSTTLSVIIFAISLFFKQNSIIQSIFISVMTGLLTSTLITYIEYNVKLHENIKYFLMELLKYYKTLYNWLGIFNLPDTTDEKVSLINAQIQSLFESINTERKPLNIELLYNTKKDSDYINIINELYEESDGEKFIINIYKEVHEAKMYFDEAKKIIDRLYKVASKEEFIINMCKEFQDKEIHPAETKKIIDKLYKVLSEKEFIINMYKEFQDKEIYLDETKKIIMAELSYIDNNVAKLKRYNTYKYWQEIKDKKMLPEENY